MKSLILKSKSLSDYKGEILPAVFQAALASLFIAFCAQIQIRLSFTPVPITIQTLAVMLVGVTLGSRKGVLAIAFYLMQGSLGAPVWAGGGAGILALFGPTGGYLMAYLLQVYIAGKAIEYSKRKNRYLLSLLVVSVFIQLGIGSLWLSLFVSLKSCLSLGFYPFILGEIVKSFIVVSYLKLQKMNKKGVI